MKRLIQVYGDSHAHYCCSSLPAYLPEDDIRFVSSHEYSKTMHRIGRDRYIINCVPQLIDKERDIIIIVYGEIDCRCHIGRQLQKGRDLKEIVDTLVLNYVNAILQYGFRHVIVLAVPPPVPIKEFEERNGPITHHLPMVGSDQERLLYTTMVNNKLRDECQKNSLYFIDPFDSYKREDGMMDFSKSDGNSHIGDNREVLKILSAFILKLISHEESSSVEIDKQHEIIGN